MKHQVWCAVLCAFALLSGSAPVKTGDKAEPDVSPYLQNLPDCSQPFPRIAKKTNARALLCPMIRDEQGFLSEWVAYYQMHGFDHIMVFDDQSVDSLEELSPWVQSGFVSLHSNWTLESLRVSPAFQKNAFKRAMTVKALLEADCKQAALRWGYDFYVSLDIDEYLIPLTKGATIVDTLLQWANGTQRSVYCIPKYNYASTPHILEPVNLLTLEAYQTRMGEPGRMNYYTSVSNKVALRLQGSKDYTNTTTAFLVHCCDFHGCGNFNVHAKCKQWFQEGERWNIDGKHRKWIPTPRINHYARSLEKYILKQGTWDTAGNGRDYDTYNFLDRVSGFKFDNSALEWTCQLRELLRNRTGEQHYLRPGDVWYRNPEFGKTVSDARKRGRNGAAFGKYLGPSEMNPYPAGQTYQGAHRPYVAPPQA